MRAVRLALFALRAEQARVRYFLRRGAVRLALGLGAVILVLAATGLMEAGVFLKLEDWVTPTQSLFVLSGLNLLAGLGLAGWVSTSRPGAAEREAGAMARAAADEIVPSLDATDVVMQMVLRWLARPKR